MLYDSDTIIDIMKGETNHLWTIEELSAQVALALSVDYAGQGSGRVRDVPDLAQSAITRRLGCLTGRRQCEAGQRFMDGGICCSW